MYLTIFVIYIPNSLSHPSFDYKFMAVTSTDEFVRDSPDGEINGHRMSVILNILSVY